MNDGAGPDAGAAHRAGADRQDPQGRAEPDEVPQYPRGRDAAAFCEILLEGLAPDGGLYLPELPAGGRGHAGALARPVLCRAGLRDPVAVHRRHSGRRPARAVQRTYTVQVFGTAQIVPLQSAGRRPVPAGLSNGPTLAFKDMAMQLLGHLFEYELARRGEQLNILGATSGDTGSAAEYAMRGKKGVRVFMPVAAGPHEPVPAGADVQPAGRRTSTTSPSKACSTTARTSSRPSVQRPGLQARSTTSAPSTRSTGRGCWRRWCTTSPVTSRPRSATTRWSTSACLRATSATSVPATWRA
jgi:hypothetical protein